MTNHKRTIWDDLAEVGRDILDKIDETLNPEKKRRELARVPVPVRPDQRVRDDYDEYQ